MNDDAIRIVRTDEGLRIELTGTISTRHAERLHGVAVEVLDAAGDVELDCSNVDSLGFAALQTLAALRIALAGHGRMLRAAGMSDALRDHVTASGFAPHLGGAR